MVWKQEPAAGAEGVYRTVVTPAMTAHHFGNEGIHVLATAMISLFAEKAIHALMVRQIEPGHGIVGAKQQLAHLAPAVVGAEVVDVARVVEVRRNRVHYAFQIHGDRQILLAEGEGESVVVRAERFLRQAGGDELTAVE